MHFAIQRLIPSIRGATQTSAFSQKPDTKHGAFAGIRTGATYTSATLSHPKPSSLEAVAAYSCKLAPLRLHDTDAFFRAKLSDEQAAPLQC